MTVGERVGINSTTGGTVGVDLTVGEMIGIVLAIGGTVGVGLTVIRPESLGVMIM